MISLIGLVNPKCIGLIGAGVVVHVPSFFEELEALERQGTSLYIFFNPSLCSQPASFVIFADFSLFFSLPFISISHSFFPSFFSSNAPPTLSLALSSQLHCRTRYLLCGNQAHLNLRSSILLSHLLRLLLLELFLFQYLPVSSDTPLTHTRRSRLHEPSFRLGPCHPRIRLPPNRRRPQGG